MINEKYKIMCKKTVKKSALAVAVVMSVTMVAFPKKAEANLQSRPNATSLTSKTASEFFLLCRQMETSGGPMGLNATIAVENDKVVETSSSNNIDVHMIKNTEYGTAAILSASEYGNCPSGISYTASTTGNSSGIMQMAGNKYEYVAGIYKTSTSSSIKYITNADAWYKNEYASNVAADSYIPGDATYETSKWRGASIAYFVASSYPVFSRGNDGVFVFGSYPGSSGSAFSSRAAVVCGAGL